MSYVKNLIIGTIFIVTMPHKAGVPSKFLSQQEASLTLLQEGPYQSSPQRTGQQDVLQQTIQTALLCVPKEVITIIATYFLYQYKQPIILHKDADALAILPKDPEAYVMYLYHENSSYVTGEEILKSTILATRIPKNWFTLQEWAYKKNDTEEDRFADGHIITPQSSYTLTELPRYTFGIDINKDLEWGIREYLSQERSINGSHTCKKLKKSRPHCIIA